MSNWSIMSFTLENDFYEKLREFAYKNKIPKGEVCRRAIKSFFKDKE